MSLSCGETIKMNMLVSLNSLFQFTTHILQQSRRVANFASTSFTMSESQSDKEGEVSFLSACYLCHLWMRSLGLNSSELIW